MKQLLGLVVFASSFLFASITEYRAFYHTCFIQNNQEYKLLRSFKKDQKQYYFVVNTTTLKSSLFTQIGDLKSCSNSYYQYLLNLSSNYPYLLHNDGLLKNSGGVAISTDLCPSSKKGFEKRLYEALFNYFPNPAPVTIFITKRWILKHPKEFHQLQQWQQARKLAITWGNHTAYHHYHPHIPDKHNFVLSPKEHLQEDIFDLEKILLENGITPSVFFRFPGLVSNKKSVELVKALGLIIIGSDAWLAKGEKVTSNSIILVHGNKNEPKGVTILLELITKHILKKITPLF